MTQLAIFFISAVCLVASAKAQASEEKTDQNKRPSIVRFDYDGIQPKAPGVYVLVEEIGDGWRVVQISELPDIRRQTSSQEVLYVKSDLTHIQPFFEKVERVNGQVFECNTFGSDLKSYTPCNSRLTKASGLGTAGKAILAIMSLGTQAGTMRLINADLMVELIRQSDLLTRVAVAQRQFARNRELQIYRNEYASLRTIDQHNSFITKYANDDPDGKLPEIIAKVAKWSKERDHIVFSMAEQKRMMEAKVAEFRSSIKVETETNCGPVLEMKSSLLKVYFPVANYGSEHWIRKDAIFPSGFGCQFRNGVYIPPVP